MEVKEEDYQALFENTKRLLAVAIADRKKIAELTEQLENTPQKRYYKKNKSKMKAQMEVYQETHKDSLKEKRKIWYEKRQAKLVADKLKKEEVAKTEPETVVIRRRVKKRKSKVPE
jgi:late competence protein required for DNA uptake (superfamily II DNA/RNA helicase)